MDREQTEKITFWDALVEHWKKIFDYKGIAIKKEYWCVLIFDLVLGVLATLAVRNGRYLKIVGIIMLVYIILDLIPLVSLTVRRLHDTGKTGWWMCLAFIIIIGFIVLIIMCMKPSKTVEPESYYPIYNVPETVYGPPEMLEDYPVLDNPDEGMEFYPEMNVPEEVYGPPEMLEDIIE